jgi:hypothetical protein
VRYQPEDSRRMMYERVQNDLNSAVNEYVIVENMKSVLCNDTYVVHGNPASVDVTDKYVRQATILDIPDLAVTKIFSFLHPPDLGRCAQVCWAWNSLVYQPCLWRTVCPVQWALGESYSIKIVMSYSCFDTNCNYFLQSIDSVATAIKIT